MLVQDDIAEQSVDAVVNETDTGLGVSGGVSLSLWQHAGEELTDDAIAKGPVGLGEVVVTEGYELDAEYILHAAVMPNYGERKATRESIERATQHALEIADDRGCESVAFPALGCGVGGFDFEDGVRIITSVVEEFESESIDDVVFVAFEDDEFEVWQQVLDDTTT